MELQVKELQKADVKTYEFNDENVSIYSIVYGHLKLHEVDTAQTTN